MLYEIHMLKNYPPTNLNRDENGAPKTCTFADTARARISSQCLKRTWRTSLIFAEAVGEENLGVRTRHMPELVCDKLRERGMNEEWLGPIQSKLTIAATEEKPGKTNDKGITPQIIFYSAEDIEALADAVETVLDGAKDTKEVEKRITPRKSITSALKDAQTRPITVDIALFGRMVTSPAFADVEASMQVAHAISTNRSEIQTDFFTAVDDIISGDPLEERGSGMMGDTDFDASCYYLYASIDTDALRSNLKHTPNADELVRKIIPALLETIAYSNPSGKQNTFAGHVLPNAVLVERKEKKIPTTLANAFAQPAHADRNGDLVQHSIEKLAQEAARVDRDYGVPVEDRWWFVSGYDVPMPCSATTCNSYTDLVDGVRSSLGAHDHD